MAIKRMQSGMTAQSRSGVQQPAPGGTYQAAVRRLRQVRALHGVPAQPSVPRTARMSRPRRTQRSIRLAAALWLLLALLPLGVGLHVRAALSGPPPGTARAGPGGSPVGTSLHEWLVGLLTVTPVAWLTAFAGTAEVTAWSPNGRYLAIGYSGGSLLVWDVSRRRLAYRMWNAHRRFVGALAWSPDGQVLASASADGRAIVWRKGRGNLLVPLLTLRTAPGHVPAIAFAPRGERVAIADGLHTVTVWPLPRSGAPHPVAVARAASLSQTVSGYTTALAWAPDGTRLAAGTLEGDVILWRVGAGRQVQRVTRRLGSRVWALAWAPDGSTLAAGCADGSVRLLGSRDLRPARLLVAPLGPSGQAAVHVVPDYGQPARVRRGKGRAPRPTAGAAINTMAWSPSGDLLAVTATGSPLRLWQPAQGRIVATYQHNWDQNAVTWRPDGSLLAVAADDGSVTLLRPVELPPVADTLCRLAGTRWCHLLAGSGGAPASYMGR